MPIHTVPVTEEIERKFIPEAVPDLSLLGEGIALAQGYLAQDGGVEVRLRTTTSAATLTIKAGSGLTRTEVEVAISTEQAEALWPHTAGRRIEKTRYRTVVDDAGRHVADVDVYRGALAGLCTVEVEFVSEKDAAVFTPPRWFGREVTGDPGWSNAALARHGVPR